MLAAAGVSMLDAPTITQRPSAPTIDLGLISVPVSRLTFQLPY